MSNPPQQQKPEPVNLSGSNPQHKPPTRERPQSGDQPQPQPPGGEPAPGGAPVPATDDPKPVPAEPIRDPPVYPERDKLDHVVFDEDKVAR